VGSGIIGIYGFSRLWKMARFLYYGLMALQHRGQETCGIVTSAGNGNLYHHKAPGLVDQVFSEPKIIEALKGWMGIGCVTAMPEKELGKIQPALVEGPQKVALCFDGKILNVKELTGRVKPFVPQSEAELFAALFSRELEEKHPLDAMAELMKTVKGVYSTVILTGKGEMVAARDPRGVKPLTIGSFGFDYGVVASESCAVDVIGADFKSDLKPGEIYYFDSQSIKRKQAVKPQPSYCAFEHVYLARPDSWINGSSVYNARMEIGKRLAKENPVRDAEVVLGVPETAIPFAVAYSNETGTPLGLGFVQTGRRVRSAIKPTQFERLVGVQLKLNPIKTAMAGKKIVLVDDSVVRGTTTKNTVSLMRNRMGAKEIHVRVGSPRLVASCPYGTEVPPEDELIAANLTPGEVGKVVGADSFHWLSLRGLTDALGIPKSRLCLGCFSGKYPLPPEEGGADDGR